jgi:TRAP transporter TAXI family solute receptor
LAGALGDEMESELDSRVSVIEGGSLSNITGLESGEFQFGFTNGQNVPEAREGFGSFDEPVEGFSGVATLYPNVMQIVVREDSDIYSIEDLEGARISPGIRGYSGDETFQEMLEFEDMSYDDMDQVEYIGTDDGANQMRDGGLDALALMLVTPQSTIQELDASIGVRLLPVPEETLSGMQERNPGYQDHTISSDVYDSEEDIRTAAGYTVLLASDDMPEDYIYDFTEILLENRDRWEDLSSGMSDFDADYSIENMPEGLELHPGAERYYEEADAL